MLDRLKSLPLTIIVTILIWMYAEAQFTAVQPDVKLNVQVIAPSPDIALRVYDPERKVYTPLMNLVVTLQGPREQIDHIYNDSLQWHSDQVVEGLTFKPTLAELSKAIESGTGLDLNTMSVLRRTNYFDNKNVTVTSVSPTTLRLEVDKVVRLQKKVEFRPSFAVERFTLDQNTVDVFIASSTLASIGSDKLVVVAEPEGLVGALPADADETIPVRFVAEYAGTRDDRIRINPAQGMVTVHTPRRQQVSVTIPDVPVWVSGPPGVMAKYDVDVQPKVVSVVVAGNTGPIEALRARLDTGGPHAAGVYAYLDLTADDKEAENASRRKLRYILPEGLSLLSGPADAAYRLTERKAAPAAGVPATAGAATQP